MYSPIGDPRRSATIRALLNSSGSIRTSRPSPRDFFRAAGCFLATIPPLAVAAAIDRSPLHGQSIYASESEAATVHPIGWLTSGQAYERFLLTAIDSLQSRIV